MLSPQPLLRLTPHSVRHDTLASKERERDYQTCQGRDSSDGNGLSNGSYSDVISKLVSGISGGVSDTAAQGEFGTEEGIVLPISFQDYPPGKRPPTDKERREREVRDRKDYDSFKERLQKERERGIPVPELSFEEYLEYRDTGRISPKRNLRPDGAEFRGPLTDWEKQQGQKALLDRQWQQYNEETSQYFWSFQWIPLAPGGRGYQPEPPLRGGGMQHGAPTVPNAAPRPAPSLPKYVDGGKTSGVFRFGEFDIPVLSGKNGSGWTLAKPAPGFNAITSTHVEGHAAAMMRQHGIMVATLYINNPKICLPCRQNIEHMLPPGSMLTIVLPDGTTVTYFGNAR